MGIQPSYKLIKFGFSLAVCLASLTCFAKTARADFNRQNCGLMQFLESETKRPHEILEFLDSENCHPNEISYALALSQNPVLLNRLQNYRTDFTVAKGAVFLLELGGDKKVALSALSAALISKSDLADNDARILRFLILTTLQDLRSQLDMQTIDTTMTSIISAFATSNPRDYRDFLDVVPYCALLSMKFGESLNDIRNGNLYLECKERDERGWRILTSI